MCNIIINRYKCAEHSIGAVQRKGEFAFCQRTVLQILFTAKHYAYGVAVVLIYKCNALNSVACNFGRDCSIAVIIDLYGNRKGLTRPGYTTQMVRTVCRTVGCNFLYGIGVGLANIIGIVFNRTEIKRAISKICGFGNLLTGCVIQAEGIVACMHCLVAAVDLQGLTAVNNNIDRLYRVGITEGNLI